MNIRNLILSALIFFGMSGPVSISFASEKIVLSIGVSPMQNIFSKIKAPYEAKTGIELVYIGNEPGGLGADQVFKDVDQGKAEGGAGGISMESWFKLMAEKGYKVQDSGAFLSRTIGRDRIQIFMNKEIKPNLLTDEQARSIFTGKVTNWKALGGEDLPITIAICSKKQPATQKFFEENFLKGVVTHTNKDLPDVIAMREFVAKTPGAVAFGPINLIDNSIKVPKHSVIGRPLTFITKGKPNERILRLLDFITKEGSRYGVAQ